MLKFILTATLSILFVTSASADELVCFIAGDANSSTLKVSYAEGHPTQLSLKSPESDVYRALDLNIEEVVKSEGTESFSAKPKIQSPIDWDTEPNCFKEVGTQWYFVFDYTKEFYGVYLTPYFELQNPKCRTPRFRPQPKPLSCSFID
jgi:hypothetical protein